MGDARLDAELSVREMARRNIRSAREKRSRRQIHAAVHGNKIQKRALERLSEILRQAMGVGRSAKHGRKNGNDWIHKRLCQRPPTALDIGEQRQSHGLWICSL